MLFIPREGNLSPTRRALSAAPPLARGVGRRGPRATLSLRVVGLCLLVAVRTGRARVPADKLGALEPQLRVRVQARPRDFAAE